MEKVMKEIEDALIQYTGIQREEAKALAYYLMGILEANEGKV